MTIRQDMLKAVSRARSLLGDSAGLVADFLRKQINPDGGFRNRFGQSDLYYTVFGLEALSALGEDIPCDKVVGFLRGFRDYTSLDLVHLACLARCLANLASQTQITNHQVLDRIEKYRSSDGGYNNTEKATYGTAYGCFLALGAYQDLEDKKLNSIVKCVRSLKRPDGGYANEPSSKVSSAPATAAALTILHYLNETADKSSVDWLLSCLHPKGGFAVMPILRGNIIPDLLSTATALHGLSLTGVSFDNIKERCLDFLDSLWSSQGAFRGNWADEVLDCEYTFYGLLALGYLS
jgi:prenyltransferase beta subunit